MGGASQRAVGVVQRTLLVGEIPGKGVYCVILAYVARIKLLDKVGEKIKN